MDTTESFNFTDAVPVWAESGAKARFHTNQACSSNQSVFVRRYNMDAGQLCSTCGAVVLDDDNASSDRLARLHQLEARLRALSVEVLADCALDTIGELTRLAGELDTIESLIPRAQALKENLAEELATLRAEAIDKAAARRIPVAL